MELLIPFMEELYEDDADISNQKPEATPSGARYSGDTNPVKQGNHRFSTKRKSQCVHSVPEGF